MSENGEIYTADSDKNFTLPPAVTALTNSTSVHSQYTASSPRNWIHLIMINHFLCIINLTLKRPLIKNNLPHMYNITWPTKAIPSGIAPISPLQSFTKLILLFYIFSA